jgi:cytochrome c553
MKRTLILASAFATLALAGLIVQAQEVKVGNCEGTVIQRFLCLKMINLRSQIYSLDTQRELMQINPEYYKSIGKGLARTAREALQIMGPDLPEHRQGLANVVRMGDELALQAEKGDSLMVVTANKIRTNCASCHSTTGSPGGGWNDIFRVDWAQINNFCNQPGKNPYACKSMYAMLGTHSYHHSSQQAKMEDYDLTRESAKELVRILADLKVKGFQHLPEKFRAEAEITAMEVVRLADDKNPLAFEKAITIVNACKNCHNSFKDGDVGPWGVNVNPFAP